MGAARPVLARGAGRGSHRRRSRRLARFAGAQGALAVRARTGGNGRDAQGGQGMAETTADVKRDIEMTRARMSDTLQELEQKMNITQIVKDNPWPALALAVGAGVILSG